jgi:hypothetical protein
MERPYTTGRRILANVRSVGIIISFFPRLSVIKPSQMTFTKCPGKRDGGRKKKTPAFLHGVFRRGENAPLALAFKFYLSYLIPHLA